MFVPYTEHSELASRLRDNELKMEQLTGYRIKIVERGGRKLVDILHKANPWAGQDCKREGCLLCKTKRDEGLTNSQDCKKRNCIYETTCLTCRDRQDAAIEEKFREEGPERIEAEKRKASRYIYVGESNRSAFERGKEHINDIGGCKPSSHMLRHLILVHEEEEESWKNIKFGMRILKSTRSAFERQIGESVLIQQRRKGNNLMNAKAEYNRCALPRLAAKLGEKDMEKWREEDRKEAADEASLEEKIRIRRKEKAKRRIEASRRMETGQPKRKKRRVEEEEGEVPGTRTGGGGEVPPVGGLVQEGSPVQPRSPPKKRKVNKEEAHQQLKKRRPNGDMKRYITCKRWKEEEKRATEIEEEKAASEEPTPEPFKDPVNVDIPGWKSSRDGQGSGVFGDGGAKSTDEGDKKEKEYTAGEGTPKVKADLTKEDQRDNSSREVHALEKPITHAHPISHTWESSEAFAGIGSLAEEVGPKKLKTGEDQQSRPAVEPLPGVVREVGGVSSQGEEHTESLKEGGGCVITQTGSVRVAASQSNTVTPGVNEQVWVQGAREEDNIRYRDFLKYMEDKREEYKNKQKEDEERMTSQKRKEQRWALMKESVKFLRENNLSWQERKIVECERIKLEEKRDRLAIVAEKKKKYGSKFSKLTKEENTKIKMRTKERLELAVAKENLWKRYQEKDLDLEFIEGEEEAWEKVRDCINNDEENGCWRDKEKDLVVSMKEARGGGGLIANSQNRRAVLLKERKIQSL